MGLLFFPITLGSLVFALIGALDLMIGAHDLMVCAHGVYGFSADRVPGLIVVILYIIDRDLSSVY